MIYTFVLRYGAEAEEIDVEAMSYVEARDKALDIACVDYLPGWELKDARAGGQYGVVTVVSL